MARKPARVAAAPKPSPRRTGNRRGGAERASSKAQAALVVMVLMVIGSLLFLAGPAVETLLFGGDPASMRLFDTAIRLASMSVSGKVALTFGYLVVALLTLLISGKIDGRMWAFVFYSSVVALICCIYAFVYVSDATFLADKLSNFSYAGNLLGDVMLDPSYETTEARIRAYDDLKDGFIASIKSWFLWGGLWNVFVIVSMIKNKVDADLLKRVIGLGI
jgi:hypothetical protein